MKHLNIVLDMVTGIILCGILVAMFLFFGQSQSTNNVAAGDSAAQTASVSLTVTGQ